MSWCWFEDRPTFDLWHTLICSVKAIPHPGRNQASDEPAILAQWTDAWVDPLQVASGAIVALVPDADAAGLTEATVIVNEFGETHAWEGPTAGAESDINLVSPISDDFFNTWRAVIPPTYTIDGVVYDTATGEVIP